MEIEEQEQNEEQVEGCNNCGECKGYFKVKFKSGKPEYYSEIKRSCRYNLFDLTGISSKMGLTEDQDPTIESCTHFETRDEIVIGRKVLDWFFNRAGDHVKKQSYEPMLLELANLLVEDKEFESIVQVSDWMLGKEEIPEPEEAEEAEEEKES
ncbi:hypothetical protein KAR91_34865 [Candidatus Pacearchaeota archaeon]|nr:hypothetical protein [Candidatus Pacearchaeota archaeon]